MDVEDSWRSQAACRNLSPAETDELFFPGLGKKSTPAKTFCQRSHCPVRDECIAFATLNDLEGYWGGTSRKERNSFISKLTAKEVLARTRYLDVG